MRACRTVLRQSTATMTTTPSCTVPPPNAALGPGTLGAWWWQGLRTWLALRPQWPGGVQAAPAPMLVAVLVLTGAAAGILMGRLFITGGAHFDAQALLAGWFPLLALAWACWLASAQGLPEAGPVRPGPGAAALFALLCAQALPAAVLAGLVLVPLYRADGFADTDAGRWIGWGTWVGLLVWGCLAQVLVLWRSGAASPWRRLAAAAVLVAAIAAQWWWAPVQHWYPLADAQVQSVDAPAPEPVRLAQEDIEVQATLLRQQLQAMSLAAPGHADRPGLYAITFAPYADEDVFRRESALVAGLMQQRFGAAGRTIQLVNHRDTVRQWPWATALNLQRTIGHMASVMRREQDVLFIHLTSHGASNGELAAAFEPLAIAPVTPVQLRRWLDEAGIRWRVISISACYSGSWIPALADARTLVMTAADAEHTSYGCGRHSALTFFGRAMYDEQLRQHHSFERAHAAARPVIARREREAGKDDGYSNPQIHVGEAIRVRLMQLEQALARSR